MNKPKKQTAGANPGEPQPQSRLDQETIDLVAELERRIRAIDGVEHLIDQRLGPHLAQTNRLLRDHLAATDKKLQDHRKEMLSLVKHIANKLAGGSD
jgi:hypothetical protein